MSRVRQAIYAALALALVAGCASRSVREPPTPLAEFSETLRVDAAWTADIGSGAGKHLLLRPALADQNVYVADAVGHVGAYRADTGRRVWRADLDVPVSGAIGMGDGLVVVGTRKGAVIALAADSGQERWRTAVSSEVLAPPAVARGVVVVQTVDGKIAGLAVEDGKRTWLYDRTEPALSLRGTSRPVVIEDIVVSGLASGRLVGLQLRDGRVLWELPLSQPRGRNEIERLVDVDAAPVVRGETLYAANYRGKLVALNLRTGTIGWSRDVSTHAGISVDDRNVYVSDEIGLVLAFDQRTGASVWRQEKLRGRDLSAPVYSNGAVLVGDAEGYVHYLAVDDGRFLARHQVASGPVRAAVAGDGTVYVSARDTLAALRATSR